MLLCDVYPGLLSLSFIDYTNIMKVTTASASVFSKYLQLTLAVVITGLSAKILSSRGNMSSTADVLSTFNTSNNGTSLDFDNSWKVSVATLSSSLFTLSSSAVNYFFPTVTLKYFNHDPTSVTLLSQFETYKYVRIPIEKFSAQTPLSVSAFHTSYLTSLVSSESVSNIFWIVNMIVSIGDYASYDCSSVDSLLNEYNVTGTSTTSSLINFFNIFDNSTSYQNVYSELYNTLLGSNLTDTTQISISNITSSSLQSNLLLAMSQDCQLKKTSMALTIIIWLTHIISTGVLSLEILNFINQYSTIRVKVQQEKSNVDENLENIEEVDKASPNMFNSVFLVYTHRWGIFKILMNSTPDSAV